MIAIVLLATIPSVVMGFTFIIVQDILQLRKDLVNSTILDADLVGVACISPLSFRSKEGVGEIVGKLKSIPQIDRGYVFDENGKLYANYNNESSGEDDSSSTPPVPEDEFQIFAADALHVGRTIIYQNRRVGRIYVVISTALLAESARGRISSLLLVMIGIIVLSYLLALRFQGYISQPVLKLARVTETISNKPDYSLRVHKEGSDEIGILYDGFNNMLEQIHLWERKRDKAEAEQQRLLEELEEKNNELEQVIYVTSHDLRSPLVNLQGFSQELGLSLKDLRSLMEKLENLPADIKTRLTKLIDDDIFDSLRFIQSSTFRMDALLSGLLKLSRVSRMDTTFENIDMNRLIKEVVNAFEFQIKEAGVKLHVGDLPTCFGNELHITQVFSNLVNNALKYLDRSRPGEIRITGEERLVEDKQQRYVLYCVADNGIGIAGEYHKKIFELFSRLYPDETEGEGLGLTIVNKIINRHHGKVWVESRPGEGSQFYILLPVLPAFSGTFSSDSSDSTDSPDSPASPETPGTSGTSGPITTSSN